MAVSRWQQGVLPSAESLQKEENNMRILDFLEKYEKIKNDDVEELLGVADSTAWRYLDSLEQSGKIIQHGETGRGVFYTLK